MTSKPDYVAQFLAQGGKIKKAAEGEGLGMTGRDWYKAVRDPVETPKPVGHRHRVASIDHMGREWYVNDEGEVIGHS